MCLFRLLVDTVFSGIYCVRVRGEYQLKMWMEERVVLSGNSKEKKDWRSIQKVFDTSRKSKDKKIRENAVPLSLYPLVFKRQGFLRMDSVEFSCSDKRVVSESK